MNRRHTGLRHLAGPSLALAALAAAAACRPQAPLDRIRASGHVEATDVQIAPEVGGRLVELKRAPYAWRISFGCHSRCGTSQGRSDFGRHVLH